MTDDLGRVPLSISVSGLNQAVAAALHHHFAVMWVSGELSSLTRAGSGHWYFTLKDAHAQVRCVMYRQKTQGLGFIPKEGESLLVRGAVSFYEPRGEFQLQIDTIRRVGIGGLYEAFVRLKNELEQQGLFAAERKKPLPALALRIGVITSPQAAALADVLRALRRRSPYVCVIVYPTLVQGDQAPAQIVNAIEQAGGRREVDVLLLVRGGGSIEDLWAFNTQAVALAIVQSSIPLISGIGHETDFTIADFVSDMRAATPTAAAEMACESTSHLIKRLERCGYILQRETKRGLGTAMQTLDHYLLRLKHPAQEWLSMRRHVDQWVHRMSRVLHRTIAARQEAVKTKANRLPFLLKNRLREHSKNLYDFQQAVSHHMQVRLELARENFQGVASILEALSAQRVLDRGFSWVCTGDRKIVKNSEVLQPAECLHIQFARGSAKVSVLNTYNEHLNPAVHED